MVTNIIGYRPIIMTKMEDYNFIYVLPITEVGMTEEILKDVQQKHKFHWNANNLKFFGSLNNGGEIKIEFPPSFDGHETFKIFADRDGKFFLYPYIKKMLVFSADERLKILASKEGRRFFSKYMKVKNNAN